MLAADLITSIAKEHGHAAGVAAVHTDAVTGATSAVTVRARHVVVAAGALESPGVLLRSGIGGPAVGRFLHLHPCTAVTGFYGEDMQAWWGAPHAGLVDEFAGVNDGYGFLIEGAQYTTAVAANATPWVTAEQHKAAMADLAFGASFIGPVRDRGHGTVTVDANGKTRHRYALTDSGRHRQHTLRVGGPDPLPRRRRRPPDHGSRPQLAGLAP